MTDDHTAVRELIADYALALDAGDIDACVQLFTADAEFLVYGRTFAGPEGIAKMFRDAPRGLHMTGVSRIEVRNATATAPTPAARAVRRRTGPPRRALAIPAAALPIHHRPRPVR